MVVVVKRRTCELAGLFNPVMDAMPSPKSKPKSMYYFAILRARTTARKVSCENRLHNWCSLACQKVQRCARVHIEGRSPTKQKTTGGVEPLLDIQTSPRCSSGLAKPGTRCERFVFTSTTCRAALPPSHTICHACCTYLIGVSICGAMRSRHWLKGQLVLELYMSEMIAAEGLVPLQRMRVNFRRQQVFFDIRQSKRPSHHKFIVRRERYERGARRPRHRRPRRRRPPFRWKPTFGR